MARSQADIANTALRIFLQQMGAAYDEERALSPYDGVKDFVEVRRFFKERCCYCGGHLVDYQVAQDHLIPLNKTKLGLHAWGNVVPACRDCNAKKQGRDWHAFLVERAGSEAAERYKLIASFVTKYKYEPKLIELQSVVDQLYEEVGSIAMTLVNSKIRHLRKSLAAKMPAASVKPYRAAKPPVD